MTKEDLWNAIDELDYNLLILHEVDSWKRQQLIEMYFNSLKLDKEMKKWNDRQWYEWKKKTFRRHNG